MSKQWHLVHPPLCANNGGVGEAVLASDSGIVSNADKPYEYTYVDSCNPPKPNYEVLLDDFQRIVNQLPTWKNNINRTVLDIDCAARRYVEFVPSTSQKHQNIHAVVFSETSPY